MKKLFALLLALAMVFALAAPALASGWDDITTPGKYKDITVKITALETEKNTSVLGGLYEELKVMYPVVKGTLVHFFVEIDIPAATKLSEETLGLLTSKYLKYKLALTNLELTKSVKTYVDGKVEALDPMAIYEEEQDVKFWFNAFAAGATYGFEYWAKGLEAGKDGVAAATIGFYNEWQVLSSDYHIMYIDIDGDGVSECIAEHFLPGYSGGIGPFADHSYAWFTFYTQTDTDFCYMWFPVDDATGKVLTSLEMFMETSLGYFAITRSVTDDITFRHLGTNAVYTPADTSGVYTALKALFDMTFKTLGFKYAGSNYITEKHFEKYFGIIKETSVKIVYPSGAVVVAPPSVTPPQTGDATTVVGFVMIALALVAAAAVTVRKVRA